MAERFYEDGNKPALPVQDIEFMGHTFKSRIEVRWAYIYQKLGIRYVYEPYEYTFIDKTKYKPDFYLPDFDCFVEIKWNNLEIEAIHKAVNLSRHTGKLVYMFDGVQTNTDNQRQSKSAVRINQHDIRFRYRWCECPDCGKMSIEHLGDERLIACPCPGKLDRDIRVLPNQERFNTVFDNALHEIKFKNVGGKKMQLIELHGEER